MRRTIGTLMVLGIISGCSGGGDGGSTAPAGDTQAPVLSLSVPGSVEGGQTVPITVTVTDNVDTGLVATLTCAGGTLTGNLLQTAVVAADTTIACTATATDKAGNRGTGSVTIQVKASVAKLEAGSSLTNIRQGQFGVLLATDLPLSATSYQGTLNGKPLTLNRGSASALTFMVPADLAPGTYPLTVPVGTRTFNFSVTVAAAPTIADPKGVVRDALTKAKASLDSFIAGQGSAMTSAQRSQFDGYSTALTQSLAKIDTLSATELATLATILAGNSAFTSGTMSSTAFNLASCQTAANNFRLAKIEAIALMASGLALIIAPELTITKIAGLAVFIKGLQTLDVARDEVANTVNFCLDESEFSIETGGTTQALRQASAMGAMFVQPTAVTGRIGFQNNKDQTLRVRHTLKLDPSVAASVQATYNQFVDLLAQLPYVPAPVTAAFAAFKSEKTEYVPSAQISLGAISSGKVSGSKSGSGDAVTLRFKAVDPAPTDQNIDFDFVLNRTAGTPITVPAQLTIALPGAEDAAITVIQDKLTSSTVTVRGADTLEVVTQPAHGTVTLRDSGAFAYTPATLYFGSDSFTYRARNAEGVSRTAMVLITVVRQFEGAWAVTSRSTTTSQSQAGLCPNETNTFTISVSKVSDTQYTTSYGGFPITLTMSSVSDPAGLAGSTTVTYPDDPGTTTETVNARIPDSNHLSGSGSFSYSGPNGTRCSGTTSITGTRQ